MFGRRNHKMRKNAFFQGFLRGVNPFGELLRSPKISDYRPEIGGMRDDFRAAGAVLRASMVNHTRVVGGRIEKAKVRQRATAGTTGQVD